MRRRRDEFEELTQEEIDKIAEAAADDIFPRVKKRPGRPKKSAEAADGKIMIKPANNKMTVPEKDPITPKSEGVVSDYGEPELNTFTTRILPIEVRNAIEEKMEIYEKTIKSYEQEINTLKDRIKSTEGKYIVLANYLTGARSNAHDEGNELQAAAAGETARIDA